MSVFITSNLLLNQELPDKNFPTMQAYIDNLIQNWNSVVGPKDKVIVMGKVGNSKLITIKSIIEKLNGEKYLVNYDENTNYRRILWKQSGFLRVWTADFFYDTTFGDKKVRVYFTNNPNKELQSNEYAVVGSKNMDALFSDKKINVNLNKWDYTPLSFETVMQLLQDLEGNEWEK